MREIFEITPRMENEKSPKGLWIKMKTMSRRRKIITLFRAAIIIGCAIGLIIQLKELLDQYMKGRTVVNINYEHHNFHNIPGISICYPVALSMVKMAEKYPHLKPLYEDYKQRLDRMTETERQNMTSYKKLSEIYFKNFTKFIYSGDVYKLNEMNLVDFFEISVPLEGKERLRTLSVEIDGVSRQELENGTNASNRNRVSDDTPIESLVFKQKNGWNKCFTFYSHLNKTWRKFKMDITKIYIIATHNDSWFPKDILIENDLQLSMHSPDELPRHDVEYYIDVKANRFIKLTYNRWKTHLLGKGYQTNCADYQSEGQWRRRMRSDCIKSCIQRNLKQLSNCNQTNCENCIFLTTALWTKEDLMDNNFTNICNNFVKMGSKSISAESNCQSTCRPKCEHRFYNYEIKVVSDIETQNTTIITIQHNQLPDQITKHIPEMTWIQFASNLGGLMGMWMGLSALAILKYIIKFFFW